MKTYMLGGGCFWCIDAVTRQLRGVESSVCGYSGGSEQDADYYRVSTGATGHAEVVQVTFDESILPANDLLDLFFLIHDPTTKDCQGNDVGPQYRSVLFYSSSEQRNEFESAIARAQAQWDEPIITKLTALETFHEAEPEHQNYYANNPTNPYCSVVISPKIIKARRDYAKYFKEG